MERYKQLIEIATDLFGGRMEETKELITTDDIRSKVYIICGQQVMLDKDLAEIYGYEVKKLNQQVKRNIERFPEDFMFRLSNSEIDSVRSQIVTSRKKDFFAGQEGGRRYLPYAFTEQGIYMLKSSDCNIVLLQCENYQIQLQMHQWNRHQALLIYISSHQEKHSLSEFPYR